MEANEVNKGKYDLMLKQATRLESTIDKLEKERDILIKDPKAMTLLNHKTQQLKKVEDKYNFYRQSTKDLETHNQELEDEIRQLKETADREGQQATTDMDVLRMEITKLTEELNDNRGRSRSRNSKNRRSASSRSFSRRKKETSNNESNSRQHRSRSQTRNHHSYTPSPHRVDQEETPMDSLANDMARRGGIARYNPNMDEFVKTNRDIPNPRKFTNKRDDSQSPEFSEWLSDVENKLQSTVFKDVQSALVWLRGLTGDAVRSMLDPYVPSRIEASKSKKFQSLEEMVAFLVRTYGKKGSEGEAHNALMTLTQLPDEHWTTFYTKWQGHRARVQLEPGVELFMLENKLNYKYTQKVAGYGKDLNKFVEKCYEEEERFKRLSLKATPRTGNGATTRTGNTGRNRGNMPFVRGANATMGHTLKPYNELPEKFKGLPKLDPTSREQLIKEGKCLRCREPGHHSRDPKCILKQYESPPYNREEQGNVQTTA